VDIVAALIGQIRPGDLASTLAMHALADLLGDDGLIDYERRTDWYQVARLRGHEALTRMLLPRAARLEAPKVHAQSDPVAAYMERPVPLGERRSLARGKDKDLLERLLLDPHPLVIRNLLENPALTEEWVLRLVTRRPVRTEVLAEVAASRRWFHRYRVRLALARNPYTPTDLSVRCVPELQTPDLADMAQDGGLHEEVVMAAREELGRRRPERPRSGRRLVSRATGLRSAAAVRGRPVAEVLGRLGGDVDLVLAGEGLLEVADPLAEGVAELGDLPRSEDEDDDAQDHQELREPDTERERQLVHAPRVPPGRLEDQHEHVVQGVGPDGHGEGAQREQAGEEHAGEEAVDEAEQGERVAEIADVVNGGEQDAGHDERSEA